MEREKIALYAGSLAHFYHSKVISIFIIIQYVISIFIILQYVISCIICDVQGIVTPCDHSSLYGGTRPFRGDSPLDELEEEQSNYDERDLSYAGRPKSVSFSNENRVHSVSFLLLRMLAIYLFCVYGVFHGFIFLCAND